MDISEKDIVVISKNTKIIHKIYGKMLTFIRSTHGVLNESNFTFILTKVMREINKNSKLYGFEKKTIALECMTLLLDIIGCPDSISRFTATIIVELIEMIYTHSMHRFKTEPKCIIL